jgi:hypothetical protein
LLLTVLKKNGRVVSEFSSDTQAPYRLLPDTGHVCVARCAERYVHVTGAHP